MDLIKTKRAGVMKSFDMLWTEAEARESDSGVVQREVRLACTGELAGIGVVGLLALRRSAAGEEVLEFVCPRCNERHESSLSSSSLSTEP
jgi:hypothetical protein